jgi:hypothetical protein
MGPENLCVEAARAAAALQTPPPLEALKILRTHVNEPRSQSSTTMGDTQTSMAYPLVSPARPASGQQSPLERSQREATASSLISDLIRWQAHPRKDRASLVSVRAVSFRPSDGIPRVVPNCRCPPTIDQSPQLTAAPSVRSDGAPAPERGRRPRLREPLAGAYVCRLETISTCG